MSQQMPPFIKLATLNNLIEAQVLGSILEQHGIPHRIRSFHDTAYDGLFQFQKGWGDLYAPAEYQMEILTILENTRNEIVDGSGAESEE